MSHADAINRAWFVLEIGVVILVLVALQICAGRTPRAYAKWPGWVRREKEPRTFWSNVGCQLLLGVFCIGLALTRFIQFSN